MRESIHTCLQIARVQKRFIIILYIGSFFFHGGIVQRHAQSRNDNLPLCSGPNLVSFFLSSFSSFSFEFWPEETHFIQ